MNSAEDCYKKVKSICFKFIFSQETKENKFKNKDRMLKKFLIPFCFWINSKVDKNGKKAEELEKNSNQLLSFTNIIKKNSIDLKKDILEHLWKVVMEVPSI